MVPIENPTINAESSMVCTDAPPVQIREKIKIGDWIKESEVEIYHPYPKPFNYKGALCKWYNHKELHQERVVGFAGIICVMKPGQWQVVDKF